MARRIILSRGPDDGQAFEVSDEILRAGVVMVAHVRPLSRPPLDSDPSPVDRHEYRLLRLGGHPLIDRQGRYVFEHVEPRPS